MYDRFFFLHRIRKMLVCNSYVTTVYKYLCVPLRYNTVALPIPLLLRLITIFILFKKPKNNISVVIAPIFSLHKHIFLEGSLLR